MGRAKAHSPGRGLPRPTLQMQILTLHSRLAAQTHGTQPALPARSWSEPKTPEGCSNNLSGSICFSQGKWKSAATKFYTVIGVCCSCRQPAKPEQKQRLVREYMLAKVTQRIINGSKGETLCHCSCSAKPGEEDALKHYMGKSRAWMNHFDPSKGVKVPCRKALAASCPQHVREDRPTPKQLDPMIIPGASSS